MAVIRNFKDVVVHWTATAVPGYSVPNYYGRRYMAPMMMTNSKGEAVWLTTQEEVEAFFEEEVDNKRECLTINPTSNREAIVLLTDNPEEL